MENHTTHTFTISTATDPMTGAVRIVVEEKRPDFPTLFWHTPPYTEYQQKRAAMDVTNTIIQIEGLLERVGFFPIEEA